MKVCCVICGELVLQGQDVSATSCGHTFHSHCIFQWLERSKTCPKCREKSMKKTLLKLFFDFSSTDGEVDPDDLQQQIDNLKFQVKLKEQEVKKSTEEAELLKVQNIAVREEFRECERRLQDKSTTILALKTQIQHVDLTEKAAKKDREEVKKLREEMVQLKWLKEALAPNKGEVEEMVSRQPCSPSAFKSLATLCITLKQQLKECVRDRTRLGSEKAAMERRYKEAKTLSLQTEELKADMSLLEEENRNQRKKIKALEQAIASPSDDVRNSALHRLLFESPTPAVLNRLYSAEACDFVTPEVVRKKPKEAEEPDPLVLEETDLIDLEPPDPPRKRPQPNPSSPPPKQKKVASSTSYPLTDKYNIMKGSRGLYSKAGTSSSSSSSISWKDRKPQGQDVGYDGLGGHHKVDVFPKLRPLVMAETLYRPRKKKADLASRGKTNTLTKYFENTFED